MMNIRRLAGPALAVAVLGGSACAWPSASSSDAASPSTPPPTAASVSETPITAAEGAAYLVDTYLDKTKRWFCSDSGSADPGLALMVRRHYLELRYGADKHWTVDGVTVSLDDVMDEMAARC